MQPSLPTFHSTSDPRGPDKGASSPRTTYQVIEHKSPAGAFGKVYRVVVAKKIKALKVFDDRQPIDPRHPTDGSGSFERQYKAAMQALQGIKKIKTQMDGFLPLPESTEIIYVYEEANPARVYPAIEMPLAEGETLCSVMHNDRGSDRGVCYNVFMRLLEHMKDFADEGYSHGDLKPENILVHGDVARNIFTVTIIDYQTVQNIDVTTTRTLNPTRAGFGTPGWSADLATLPVEGDDRSVVKRKSLARF